MSQVIRLVGVFDDGSARREPVPVNSAKTIQFPQGLDVTLEVEVVTNAGVPVRLADSSPAFSSTFRVMKDPAACAGLQGRVDYQLAGTLKAGTVNVVQFAVPAQAFNALNRWQAGRYFYDVGLTYNSRKYEVVRISGFHLELSFQR